MFFDIGNPALCKRNVCAVVKTHIHCADRADIVHIYKERAVYLNKFPVSSNAFFAAMDDILRVKTQEQGHFLVLKSRIGVHKVPLSELIYVEAQNRKESVGGYRLHQIIGGLYRITFHRKI